MNHLFYAEIDDNINEFPKANKNDTNEFIDVYSFTITSNTMEDSVLTTASVFNLQCTLKAKMFGINSEEIPTIAPKSNLLDKEGESFTMLFLMINMSYSRFSFR